MIKLEITDKKIVFEYNGNGKDLMAELTYGIDTAIKTIADEFGVLEDELKDMIFATIIKCSKEKDCEKEE